MLPGIFLSGVGVLLAVWGYVRIKHDFKDNKEMNNFFSLLLTDRHLESDNYYQES